MTFFRDTDFPTISIPGIDPQDIEQEAELLRLEGKTPNKSIIKKRLQGDNPDLTYDFTEELNGSKPNWRTYNPDPDAIKQLAKWALRQSDEIRDEIFEFIDNPTDKRVDEIIKKLIDLSILSEAALEEHRSTLRHKGSIADMLLRELSATGPRTEEELYSLEATIQSKRPRAAIRQTLRRLVKTEKVKLENDTYRII
jgi:hypothetical protein